MSFRIRSSQGLDSVVLLCLLCFKHTFSFPLPPLSSLILPILYPFSSPVFLPFPSCLFSSFPSLPLPLSLPYPFPLLFLLSLSFLQTTLPILSPPFPQLLLSHLMSRDLGPIVSHVAVGRCTWSSGFKW